MSPARRYVVGFLHRLQVLLDPPPEAVEPVPLTEKQSEALDRAAREADRVGRRQGFRAWNYHRPKPMIDQGDLRYMLDVYGERGTAERLIALAQSAETSER